jgi:uncharacterized damage-inducible protein DinB
MPEDFHKLFAYDHWANGQALASIRQATLPPARTFELAAHLAAAQWLWLARLGQAKQKPAVWPTWSLDDTQQQLAALRKVWTSYLNAWTAEELSRAVRYTNSQGESWTNLVEDILRHVLMHGAYHRGQIATHLRAAGQQPAYTDYIHAVRRGEFE